MAGRNTEPKNYNEETKFNPDYETSVIRVNGSIIKVKNYFLNENKNCTVLLHCDKAMVRVVITDGRIDEYESLPIRPFEKDGDVPVAWLFRNNRNKPMHHKRLQEG